MGSVCIYRDPAYPFYHVTRCLYQSHAARKHTHKELAVSLVTGGASLFRFGEQEHRIRAGQLVMIAPGFVHQCCPEAVEEWSFTMVFIDPGWLEAVGLNEPGRPCFIVRDLESPAFQGLQEQYRALCVPGEPKEEVLLYIMDQALSDPEPPPLALKTETAADEEALQQVCDHIRGHLAETIPLETLSGLAGLEKYRLIRSFTRRFNTTPHAWQLMLRMAEARQRLDAGAPITDTALAVGFYDQSHFTRLFKASFGMTPGQYAQQRKGR